MAIFGYINEIVKNIEFNKTISDGLNYLTALAPDLFKELNQGESSKVSLIRTRFFVGQV